MPERAFTAFVKAYPRRGHAGPYQGALPGGPSQPRSIVTCHPCRQVIAFPAVGGPREAIELLDDDRQSRLFIQAIARVDVLPSLEKRRERREICRFDLRPELGQRATARAFEDTAGDPAVADADQRAGPLPGGQPM